MTGNFFEPCSLPPKIVESRDRRKLSLSILSEKMWMAPLTREVLSVVKILLFGKNADFFGTHTPINLVLSDVFTNNRTIKMQIE